jgi:hypothetical protein
MLVSKNRHAEKLRSRTIGMSIALVLVSLALAACSGGTGTPGSAPQPPVAQCIPSDPSTAGECGTVMIGLTDADGEFLSYTVDVLSLALEKRNGAQIEVLPARTRIDFAQYVDLTELVSVASVPPGDYVAGSIRLDFTGAEIFVEAGGVAKEATVVGTDGVPLGETELTIRLDDRNHLAISKGRIAFLTLDFDLDASHSVDITSTPAAATAEPFMVAELNPVDSKDIRIRGRLIEANVAEMYYTIALRPFFDAASDFGRIRVNVTERTDFDVNEEIYVGAEGLRALNVAGQGTLTIARGTVDTADRSFTADYVLAGTSVPGNGMDAIKGSVISRAGNDIVVRGGTVMLTESDRTFFHDDVTVTIGSDTVVYKSFRSDRPLGMPISKLGIEAISVGQAVTIRGAVTVNDESGIHLDATQGTVAMHLTHLSGIVNSVMTGQTDIELHAIDRRRVEVFDFAGTGSGPATDADPGNYEVATGSLAVSTVATGQPVVVYGFPYEYGSAPPDFEGRTVIDFADVRSSLGIGWGTEGSTAPFLMIDNTGLLLDNQNPDIDQRHYIKQGPVVIDLAALDSNTVIAPADSGRTVFTVKTRDSLQLYNDFDDFADALTMALDGANRARSMYARGHFNGDTNVFTVNKVFVYILEP